ncbi:hypothetical protein D9758_005908 [Tetrapyrgos nigripes]|uniref:Alpha/beta hydrolase fold-3 domain-containing protein n=1 Tax=Tetrapyrgos nigripes TaxID=182062 RepID=A0A8H5G2S4_9AGAR|nr:hypothetical protein D9758_005908 [Tetrapyrgos nigripes]
MNPLTRNVGLRVGPIVLETLVKHYFERIKEGIQTSAKEVTAKDGKEGDSEDLVQLRQDELLYDEAFNIIKAFLAAAALHTVEELQNFSNTRTPSPPWVHVIRLVVPMSSCDEAAVHLTKALGGEDVARKVVGGVKWWQIRAVSGVDAEWITAKKDWQDAKKRHKMQEKMKQENGDSEIYPEDSANDGSAQDYEQDMDRMRCILYLHGGGYYFGSVDQERYSIQRYARKINGRVFAINYRLAPQYPFPCAIQDALAAYLYLIRPPPDAQHKPIKPSHIVVAGDSAGGGLSLALLQVLRDSDLPLPAGGVLISPWCDLTHSFPSIHINTATDVIPQYGLSLHKPSPLWPPPSDEITVRIRSGLRHRIRHTLGKVHHDHPSSLKLPQQSSSASIPPSPTASLMPVDVGTTTPFPSVDPNAEPLENQNNQKVSLTASNGEVLTVEQQVQFYTLNNLVTHPLVSPALSYLGGLPPLLFIASDKEVLRDEIIYTAHKAANPEKFPIKNEVRAMYPALNEIESRYGPTPVHLQVYDDTAHVLPVLFSFTTPAKFCFRAIASFCKYVTGMSNTPSVSESKSSLSSGSGVSRGSTVKIIRSIKSKSSLRGKGSIFTSPEHKRSQDSTGDPNRSPASKSLTRSISDNFRSIAQKRSLSRTRSPPPGQGDIPPLPPLPLTDSPLTTPLVNESTSVSSVMNTSISDGNTEVTIPSESADSKDLTGDDVVSTMPNLGEPARTSSPTQVCRLAGDPVIYSETAEFPSMRTAMIRERVSTRGVVRPLEPEEELNAMKVPPELIGELSELAVRRYIDGLNKYNKKFSSTFKHIEKHRRRNYEKAQKDTIKNMSILQHSLDREVQQKREAEQNGTRDVATPDQHQLKDGLLASSGWIWSWALDDKERPPPSSIVSRRDVDEALRLARIADLSNDGSTMSGNNLWGIVNNFLTPGSKKDAMHGMKEDLKEKAETKASPPRRSLFPRVVSGKSSRRAHE